MGQKQPKEPQAPPPTVKGNFLPPNLTLFRNRQGLHKKYQKNEKWIHKNYEPAQTTKYQDPERNQAHGREKGAQGNFLLIHWPS